MLRVFALLVVWAGSLVSSAAPQVSYAWANHPTASQYDPEPVYSHNASGGRIMISRGGVGVYTLRFVGFGGKGAGGGHVQVTAYGAGADQCKVASWGYAAPDFIVNVRCFQPNGAPADTRYTVLAGWPDSPAPALQGATRVPAEPPHSPGDSVQRTILENGTVEFRYPDGTIVRHAGTCKEVTPPGGEPRKLCYAFTHVPYNLPPLSDQEPRGLGSWVQDRSDDVMGHINALLGGDQASVGNYQRTEADLDPYQRVERRLALVGLLLGQR
jgi:hypothetical protein